MDRDYIIHIVNLDVFGGLRDIDMIPITYQFLLEKGKDPEIVSKFIDMLKSSTFNRVLLIHCFNTALEYFEHKFGVCRLYECTKDGERIKVIKVF